MKYRKQSLYQAVAFVKENRYYYILCLSFGIFGLLLGIIQMSGQNVVEFENGSIVARSAIFMLCLYAVIFSSIFFDRGFKGLVYAAMFLGGFRAGQCFYFLPAFCGIQGVLNMIFLYLWIIVLSFCFLSTACVMAVSPNITRGCGCCRRANIKWLAIVLSILLLINIFVVLIFSSLFDVFFGIIIVKI